MHGWYGMENITIKSGDIIAKKNDKVNYWYLIQEGEVIQKIDNSEVRLGKNAIIGILERNIFVCDYVAGADTVLTPFSCENADDLKKVLSGKEIIRNIFLKAAIEQRHKMLVLYNELYNKARQFHTFVENVYNDYKGMCSKYNISEMSFSKMEYFDPLVMQHKAEDWEINNSISLVKNYVNEYIKVMEKDDSLTVGVIMEAAAQMRRFTLGIAEMDHYLNYNKDILIGESCFDIFRLYFELSKSMSMKKYDITTVKEKINYIAMFADKIGIYSKRLLSKRLKDVKEYNYDGLSGNNISSSIESDLFDVTKGNNIEYILEYAGYTNEEVEEISEEIKKYHELPDMFSSDKEVYALRKRISNSFYNIYSKVFFKAVEDERNLSPIIKMFLNFGYMDVSFVGEDNAKALHDLCAHIDICSSEHIYTIYEWLKAIYYGEKEPSKNEFDMNYNSYLLDLVKNGKITEQQQREYFNNKKMRVDFEIKNMFASVNKTTYGRVTTFCPVLCAANLINSIDRMLVTAEKLDQALNEIRNIDYSVFFREFPFSEPEYGVNNEKILKEVLPDFILMPNAGTNVMMWQETSGIKSNTPARIMFPIFTSVDVEDLMLIAIGRFRWEMCRKLEGVHWNDIRENSLTAEYCSYIQFYKKNNDLSPDAKEKLKSALVSAKNNFREVFVKDYANWIKFESKGSFRVNKIARDILVRHCPFPKAIRNDLKINPMYQSSITRFETENTKKLQRSIGILNKYEKAGGFHGAELNENITFYEM